MHATLLRDGERKTTEEKGSNTAKENQGPVQQAVLWDRQPFEMSSHFQTRFAKSSVGKTDLHNYHIPSPTKHF